MLLKEIIYMQRSFWCTETIPKAMLIANKDWKFSPRKWNSSLAFLIMHGNDFQLQEKIDFQVHITKRQCIAMLNYHKRYALLLKYTWPPQPLKWYGKCLPREALHRLEMSISGNRPTFTWKDIDSNIETPYLSLVGRSPQNGTVISGGCQIKVTSFWWLFWSFWDD